MKFTLALYYERFHHFVKQSHVVLRNSQLCLLVDLRLSILNQACTIKKIVSVAQLEIVLLFEFVLLLSCRFVYKQSRKP